MLNDKELLILRHLRENARSSVTDIAAKVGLPRSTVYEKIKKLRKEGIVNKYSCLVNFNQLGLPIQAKVLFRADGEDRAKLGDALANSMHANNVVKLGNDYDYLASFVFSSMNELHGFLDELTVRHKIKEHKILYVAKELKREGFCL